jgi:crossover junction endodeoxyribonuclease RuvC
VRVFGIDPGSVRTGYGCVDSDGSRHGLVACGAVAAPPRTALPDKLRVIHDGLLALIREARPDCVVVEKLFHARNVHSALVLGHARGVAVLAAVEAGLPVVEYTPAEIKQAVVGYGRAGKRQMQQMVQLLLGLDTAPRPHDAADALAVAIRGPGARSPAGATRTCLRRRRGGRPRDRPSVGHAARQAGAAARRRRRRGRLRRARAALHLLRRRRAGQPGGAPHPHARARGRASPVRLQLGARAATLPPADRRQRHRAESRAVDPLRHRADRPRARRAHLGPRPPRRDSRRRQEDGRAARRGAARPAAGPGRGGARRAGRRRRARRRALGPRESRLPARGRREGGGSPASAPPPAFEPLLRDVLKELAG